MRPPANPRSPVFRHRSIRVATAALALLPVLVGAAPPAGGGDRAALQHQIETLQRTAQQLDLQRQIEALQRTVQQLERRVRTLEKRPAPPPRPVPAPPPEIGQGHPENGAAAPTTRSAPPAPTSPRITAQQAKANWGALKRGMSPGQVRILLGAPSRQMEINDGHRLWYYTYPGPRNGSVMFSRDGVVSDWQHPPFGWLW